MTYKYAAKEVIFTYSLRITIHSEMCKKSSKSCKTENFIYLFPTKTYLQAPQRRQEPPLENLLHAFGMRRLGEKLSCHDQSVIKVLHASNFDKLCG